MASESVLIVGGGLSGLATAFYLNRAGIRTTIVEKSNRLGGLIRTDRVCGCDLEAGPDSFLSTKTAVAELAHDLGDGPGERLTDKIIGSNDQARRIFIVRRGRLVPMPKAMSMMVPTEWPPVLQSKLLGANTKLRLFQETLTRPRVRDGDFSVGELVSSHFSKEMLDYITEPLLSGVYGGDAASLSARSVLPRFVEYEERYGSLIRGARENAQKQPQQGSLFRSFEGGMQTLTDALAKAISGKTSVIAGTVHKVDRQEHGWRVSLGAESISSRRIVLACPAWIAADLLKQSAPSVAEELRGIPYSSAILGTLLFKANELNRPLNGFGFLAPKQERQSIAAATWVNIKFPSRIAAGFAALRGFIVGDKAEAMCALPDDDILNNIQADFERLMNFKSQAVFRSLQRWPKSMPQYVVGHQARIDRLTAALKDFNGLLLTGNYIDGIGIPDTIRRAKEVAKQIQASSV